MLLASLLPAQAAAVANSLRSECPPSDVALEPRGLGESLHDGRDHIVRQPGLASTSAKGVHIA
jgi:hypothetical protein